MSISQIPVAKWFRRIIFQYNERKLMKTKMIKGLLVLMGAATLLLAGCSSTNQGGAGGDTMYGAGEGGPNGSTSPTNPFGLGTGTGPTPVPAH
jgi:hypothetical protein